MDSLLLRSAQGTLGRVDAVLIATLLVSLLTGCSQQQQRPTATATAADPPSLQLPNNVFLGGAAALDSADLSPTDLVIDLRTDEDLAATEAPWVVAAQRQRLPIQAPDLPGDHLATLAQLLDRKPASQRLWLVCNSGNRAAWLWALHRVRSGSQPAVALQEVDALATYPPIRSAILSNSTQLEETAEP